MPKPYWIVIAWFSAATAGLMPVFFELKTPPLLPYHWHKLLHVLGAILFLGNMVVTGAWVRGAMNSGSPRMLRFGARMVAWCDVFFTGPGFFLIAANAPFLATAWGGGLRWSWIVAALGLFVASGLVGIFAYIPQIRLYKLAAVGDEDEPLPAAFHHELKRWGVWGAAATFFPLLIFVLMLVKPRLWGAR